MLCCFVLEVVEAVDAAQLQAFIDVLPLNSAALEQFKRLNCPNAAELRGSRSMPA